MAFQAQQQGDFVTGDQYRYVLTNFVRIQMTVFLAVLVLMALIANSTREGRTAASAAARTGEAGCGTSSPNTGA